MSFEQKLKWELGERLKSISSIEEIYENAENRQDKLFTIIFQECFFEGLKNFIKKINFENYKELIKILQERNILKNVDISFFIDIFNTDKSSTQKLNELIEKDLLNLNIYKNRKSAENFLNENFDIFDIKILDGNVKKIERALEKSKDRYNGDFKQVNDINRLTIISNDPVIIEKLINNLKEKFRNDFLARDRWEMKSFGMIARSSYLFLNNFPCEIHFNEPKQMEISKEITHRIYELYRLNPEKKDEFKKEFLEFINDIKQGEYKGNYLDILHEAFEYKKIKEIDFENIDEILKLKKLLLDIHIKIHQRKIIETNDNWQLEYLTALNIFNQENKKQKMDITEEYKKDIITKAFNNYNVYMIKD